MNEKGQSLIINAIFLGILLIILLVLSDALFGTEFIIPLIQKMVSLVYQAYKM